MNQAIAEQWFCDPEFYKIVPLGAQEELYYGRKAIPDLDIRVHVLEERMANLAKDIATMKFDIFEINSRMDSLEIKFWIALIIMVVFMCVGFYLLKKEIADLKKEIQNPPPQQEGLEMNRVG